MRFRYKIWPLLLIVPLLAVALFLSLLAVGSWGESYRVRGSIVDCGGSDERPPDSYDVAGRDCFWSAYSAGKPARWTVTSSTVEGDPIRATISFDQGVVVVTRDMSSDRFSSERDRRIWRWTCRTMTQRTWATDAQRFSFELSDCTGDGTRAVFP